MKVLLFSPYSLVARHVQVEQEVSTYLSEIGWDIDVITCAGGLKDFCVSMASIGLDYKTPLPLRQVTCQFCKAAKSTRIEQESGIRFHDLEQWKNAIPVERVRTLVSQVSPTNWSQHEFEGISIGRFAAVDLLMLYKINSFQIPDEYWQAYLQQLEMNYRLLFAIRAAIYELSPDRVLVYNTLFGPNRIVKVVSEQSGSPCYSIHLGFQSRPDSNAVMLYRDDDSQIKIAHTAEARKAIRQPCSEAGIKETSKFYNVTLNASSHTVYSSKYIRQDPQVTREMLGVSFDKPIISVPLASADERFALSLLGLPSLRDGTSTAQIQTDWLLNILAIAAERPDWQFIIRPHPRMFPNHRDRFVATEVSNLLNVLARTPPNVRVNLPTDGLSLANVLQISDVVFGGTSSAGLEALAYGLPVITHDPSRIFAFPAEIGLLVDSPDRYATAIETAISVGWSLENVRVAVRWMSFLNRQVARHVYRPDAESKTDTARLRPLAVMEKMVREKRLFNQIPQWISVFLSGQHLVGQVKRNLNGKSLDPGATVIRETLEYTLSGLHEVVSETVRSEANETANLRVMLTGVLELLGNYSDDRCLSFRIQNFLSS